MKNELALGGGRLLRSFASYFHDWRRRNALQREFQALGAAEGERVLNDCGMSRSEFLSSLQNSLLTEDLLTPAMLSLGLNPIAFKAKHPEWGRDLERACMSCRHRLRCRDDVSARRFATSHRSYCVNSDSFRELAQRGKAA